MSVETDRIHRDRVSVETDRIRKLENEVERLKYTIAKLLEQIEELERKNHGLQSDKTANGSSH